uniref:Uncharacterized protein n=1 Tax=Klebsiella oxytoca TaxID=571 RepID=A0A1Z3MM41_KLEOX|nr:hypothetical protein [Klebsiella oxytoca]ASD48771.1 hypothetical protein [Klebsiella oxytoca]
MNKTKGCLIANFATVPLVVPVGLHKAFPEEIRGELMSLSAFIDEIKKLYW